MGLTELGQRLLKPSTGMALKRFILGLTVKFDWPEWVPWIHQALQHEADLGLFDEGCAALGRLEMRSALLALQDLAARRTDPDRQLILRRELGAYEFGQPLSFHLNRITEGEGNPRLAHQGARGLAAMAQPEDLDALQAVLPTADSLSYLLLLRSISELPGGPAGACLRELFLETLRTLEDLDLLDNLTHKIQAGARNAARSELLQALTNRMSPRASEWVQNLEQAVAEGEAGRPLPFLERLQEKAEGPYERFLTEALTALLEGKVARFNAMITEAQDMASRQAHLLGVRFEQICESLMRQVTLGYLEDSQVLPAFQDAFERYPRSSGLDYAYCRLIPPDQEAGLRLLLKSPDPKRRSACLDVLGAREEDALVPFFLEAMQDPIIEVGQRAMHHFARLPSSFPAVMARFQSGQVEEIRAALRIFTENATPEAAGPVMAFLRTDVRDDLILEAVEALGSIGSPEATPVLLDLLHDGKPIRLQEALVAALANIAAPESALGLLTKSAHLKPPQVLIVALEGTLAAFPGFERPIPQEHLPALEQLIARCCDEREGEGQRLPAILATQNLYCFDQDFYTRLKETFSDFLFDLRTKGGWDRETNDRVAAVVKELGRRSASLSQIAKKEERVRTLLKEVPAEGPRRAQSLLDLRDALCDPEFIMRIELAKEVAHFVQAELGRKDQEWRELARLCEIGGASRQASLVEPIKEHFAAATGLGLRSAAKEALLALGLSEADITRRAPIRTILLLEPSAFFRKRLLAFLGEGWEVREAATRVEATPLLEEHPADLIISELSDGTGDLWPWLQLQHESRHCRFVLLSTATRDFGSEEPWLLGILHKPYPPGELLKALEP
jgi:CheY-like chemotaxis protein